MLIDNLDFDSGGPTYVAFNNICELLTLGTSQIDLFIAAKADETLVQKLTELKCTVHKLKIRKSKFVLYQKIRQLSEADFIVFHGLYSRLLLLVLLIGKPSSNFFLVPHGSLLKLHRNNRQLAKCLFRLAFRLIIKHRPLNLIFLSKFEELESSDWGFLRGYRHLTAALPFRPKSPAISIKKESTSLETLRIVQISRFVPEKGFDKTLNLLDELNKYFPRAELLIIGSGSSENFEYLDKLIKQLKLEKYVTILGPIPNDKIVSVIKRSDYSVVLSDYENFSLVALESVMSGIPVITNTKVGFARFISDYHCGIIADHADMPKLARFIFEQHRTFHPEMKLNCGELSKSLITKQYVTLAELILANVNS